MDYIILAVSVLFNIVSSVLNNTLCKKRVRNNADVYFFNAIQSFVTIVGLLLIYAVNGQAIPAPSLFTVLLGILFGVITALCALFNLKALRIGPLSYTKVIISSSLVIPSLCGFVLYNQSISVWQIIAIVLLIASFILAVDRKKDNAKASLKWFIFCMVSFLACGGVGVMQTVHQKSEFSGEISAFLLIAFAVSSIVSSILTLVYKKKHHFKITLIKNGKPVEFIVITLICGIATAFCNHYNMYLSGVIDTAVLFPLLNGSSMVLTTVYGLVVCKEKLNKAQAVGLVVGSVAILLLCNVAELIVNLF